jgi:hypothetical protein
MRDAKADAEPHQVKVSRTRLGDYLDDVDRTDLVRSDDPFT